MRRGLLAVVILAGIIGCAAGPHPTAAPPRALQGAPGTEPALPIPPDLVPRINESIELGRVIYFLDKASAIGTDVMKAKVPDFQSRGLGGWLAVLAADESGAPLPAFAVMFISRDEPFRMLFRIDVPLEGAPVFNELHPPKPLEDLGVRLFRARQTALRAIPPGARPWNPVVLPGAAIGRGDAILVYLLAAEQRPGEMVFGSHYQILVSTDGATIKQALPLSNTALVIPPPEESIPPGATPVATMVSQIATDWPLETHVFVSLLHNRAPIYVTTRRGVWLVIGDKITLVSDNRATSPRTEN